MIERSPRVLRKIDRAENPPNLDHHRLLASVPPVPRADQAAGRAALESKACAATLSAERHASLKACLELLA
jgi:hypothetical protein